MSLDTALNCKQLKFDKPERHDLSSGNRHYYTQSLNYNGRQLMLTTDWFRSEGICYGLDKRPEMLVSLSPHYRNIFKAIEEEAIKQLKLPSEFQTNESNEAVFKRMPSSTAIFAKLNRDAAFFNKLCNPLKRDELTYGDYRVILHVKGIYIGQHGHASKLVSLQLRICQVQFIPLTILCLFDKSNVTPTVFKDQSQAVNHNQLVKNLPETPQPGTTKKIRRPRLQRQNAVTETKVQESMQQPMEKFPTDFFDDLDLDAE